MSAALELFFDHSCPYSYMAFTATRRLAVDRGLQVQWRPLPLAGRAAHLSPAEEAMHQLRHEADWPRIEALAASGYRLDLTRPIWGTDSRMAVLVAHWAIDRRPELAADVHAAVFRAYFELGLDISDPAVLAAATLQAGIEATGLPPVLDSADLDAVLAEDAALAADRGVATVPALVVGDYLLVGAQPVAVLERALAQVMSAGHRPVADR